MADERLFPGVQRTLTFQGQEHVVTVVITKTKNARTVVFCFEDDEETQIAMFGSGFSVDSDIPWTLRETPDTLGRVT